MRCGSPAKLPIASYSWTTARSWNRDRPSGFSPPRPTSARARSWPKSFVEADAVEHFLDTFFKPAILASTWPAIAKGMLVTIEIAILVVITGLALGLFLALLRTLRYRLLDILI